MILSGLSGCHCQTSWQRQSTTATACTLESVKSAYLDGGLCALNADGVPMFSRLRPAMDEGRTDELVFFAFDLLFLTGKSAAQLPLIQRGDRLQRRFKQQ